MVNSLLQYFGEAVTSWLFTVIYCAGIVALGLGYYFGHFRRHVLPVRKALVRGLDVISSAEDSLAFASRFESVHQEIGSDPVLAEVWSEYYRGLIMPSGHAPQIIRSSEVAASVFSVDRLLSGRLNLRMCMELPNYLTGLGILGTFIGLTGGVFLAQSGLASAESETIHQSLKSLLAGASLAFSTSMVGLLTSLGYSWREKKRLRVVEHSVVDMCTALEQRVVYVSAEQIAAEYLAEAKAQTIELRRFNTELAVSISTALDERLAGRFAPMLDRAIVALEGVRADRGQDLEKLIREMVSEFKTSLSGAAGAEIELLGTTLRGLTERLGAMAEQLSGAGTQAGQGLIEASQLAAGEIRQLMTQLGQQLVDARRESDQAVAASLGSIGHQLEVMGEFMRTATGQAGRTLAEAADGASERMQTAAIKIGESFLSGAGELEEQLRAFASNVDQLTRAVESGERLATTSQSAIVDLNGSIEALRSANDSIRETSRPLADTGRALIAQLEHHEEMLAAVKSMAREMDRGTQVLSVSGELQEAAWKQIEARFESLDKVLQGSFSEIERGLEAYTNGIREFVRELDQSMSRATQLLAGAIGELRETVEEIEVRK